MASTRVTSRFPVSTDLVSPLELIIDLLEKSGADHDVMAKAKRSVEIAKQQAVKLNQLLTDLQNSQQDVVGPSTGTTGGSGGGGSLAFSGVTPSPVGATGSVGSNVGTSHADHVHQGVRSFQLAGELLKLYGDVTLSEGSGIDITQAVSDLEIAATRATRSKVYHLPIIGPRVSVAGTGGWAPVTYYVPVRGTETESVRLVFPWKATNAVVTAEYRLYDVTNSTVVISGTRSAPFSDTLEVTTAAASAMPGSNGRVALQVKGTAGEIELYGPVMWEAA